MAIRHGQGGNCCTVIGGQWNSHAAETETWNNPLAGATALTIAISIKPIFTSYAEDRWIFGQEDIFASESTFSLRENFADKSLQFRVVNFREGQPDIVQRIIKTTGQGIFTGTWQRLFCRWRASDQSMSIWSNGVALATTLVVGDPLPRFGPFNPGPWAPFEIGAQSYSDFLPVHGDYAEAAIWSSYLPDSDAVKYGQGYSPNLLTNSGRCRYVKLTDVGQIWTEPLGGSPAGTVLDEWNGVTYGAGQPSPWGGVHHGAITEGETITGFQTAPHPTVFYTEPSPAHLIDDVSNLPIRGFEPYELQGYAGKRSGQVLNVPSQMTLDTAFQTVGYGGTVVVDPAAAPNLGNYVLYTKSYSDSTPRMPPRSQAGPGHAWLTTTTPVTASAPITATVPAVHGKEPAYIEVVTAGSAALPAVPVRDIALPDSTRVRVLDGGRITAAHLPSMAILRNPNNGSAVLNSDENFVSTPVGWMFRGLRIQNHPSQAWPGLSSLLRIVGNIPFDFATGPYYDGARPTRAQRILFTQCSFEGDPGNTGRSATQVASVEGDYIGFVNSRATDCFAFAAAETKLFHSFGDGHGPIHWENNELQTFTAGLFTGGGGTASVDVNMQDLVWMRNWQHCPLHWRRSECNTHDGNPSGQGGGTFQGYLVNIAANGTTVSFVPFSGEQSELAATNLQGPHIGCTMYEPATGKARRITAIAGDNPYTGLTLDTTWGGTLPASNVRVYFQYAAPNVQYNSGWDTPMPLATATAASNIVTFNTPLPAGVRDESSFPGAGHFFYTNDTHWNGGTDFVLTEPPIFTTDPKNTAFGAWYGSTGITKAQCRRKRIWSIAPDRLSCQLGETASDPNANYFENITFPYSIVTFDGLYRSQINKSTWETKIGVRMLWQGNVFEHGNGGGANHPTAQTDDGGGFVYGEMTIVGNQLTVTPGSGSLSDPAMARARLKFGKVGPRMMIGRANDYGAVRDITKIHVDLLACELEPTPAGFIRSFGNVTNEPMYIFKIISPWQKTERHIWRYNIIKSWTAGASSYTGIVNFGEHRKGKNFIWHDNLFVKMGDLAVNQNGCQGCGLSMGTQGSTFYLLDGSTELGIPITNDNGDTLYYHNSHVHEINHHGFSICFTINRNTGLPINKKAQTIEIIDNVFVGFDAGTAGFFNGDPDAVWDQPCLVHRNVFGGASGPGIAADPNLVTRFPDNGGVSTPDRVGFSNYASPTWVNPLNFTLVDVYTTGTVSIAADGLSAVLDSGNWPSTVVKGQFFRTTTNSTLKRISEPPTSTTIRWVGAHPEANASGKSFVIGFKGTASDGLDPGINADLVEQFTRGVRGTAIDY